MHCLDRERQIGVLAAKYNALDSKTFRTPMSAHLDLIRIAYTPADFIHFRQLVDALQWIGMHTHLDIMHPVAFLAQLCTRCDMDHFLTALRIPKYSRKDKKLTLRVGHVSPLSAHKGRCTLGLWLASTDRKKTALWQCGVHK